MITKGMMVAFGLPILMLIIAIGDYYLYGLKKIVGKRMIWTKRQIIIFYFQRSVAEATAFIMGVIFAWSLLS